MRRLFMSFDAESAAEMRVLDKLRQTAGETLVETLFALVIIVLAFTFFPTAIMAATNIASRAEETAGTCSFDRSEENIVPSAYIAFRTAKEVKDGTGLWDVSPDTNMEWAYNADGSTYTVNYDVAGTGLAERESTDASSTPTKQSKIQVTCYANAAEGGSDTPDYYFYDTMAVK